MLCRKCGLHKDADAFYAAGGWCKSCRAAYSKSRRKDPAFLRREKSAGLKYRYGITVEDAELLLRQQGGGCGVCLDPLTVGEGHVDHDHQTGKVRGVLCRRCNVGIGEFRDNPVLLQVAADYVAVNRREERCLASW